MRITIEEKVLTIITTDIICNKCGKSCHDIDGANYEGVIEHELCGGWGSKVIGDGYQHQFSLCETCFMELSKTFVIPSLTHVPS